MRRIVERLGAAREAAGWDMNISVDCHMCYDVPSAITLAQELAPLKLKWLEDPTPVINVDAVRQVREKSPVPICVGEMFTAEQFRNYIAASACDILHPDVLFAGGLLETSKIAQLADLHHLPVALHNNSSSVGVVAAAHLAASVPNLLGMEYHFYDARWIGELADRGGRPLLEKGHLLLGDEPGLGLTLDEEVCRQHLAPGEVYFGN
jgi:galactonate dehydratase